MDPPFWARKSGPAIRAAGADSARWGAKDVVVQDGRIYTLSGGRPVRAAHMEGEPTRFVDIYDLQGEYEGSYYIPFDSWEFAIRDDGSLWFLTLAEGMYPQLVGLRPRVVE